MRPYTTREKAKITAGAITALIIVGWGGILAGDTFRQMKRPPTDGVDGPLTASMCQNGGRQRTPATGAIHGRYYYNWS